MDMKRADNIPYDFTSDSFAFKRAKSNTQEDIPAFQWHKPWQVFV